MGERGAKPRGAVRHQAESHHPGGRTGVQSARQPWHGACPRSTGEENIMLWTLLVLLLLFWVLGFAFDVAGGLIHILLVIALVLFLVNLISGRRTTV
jgi:uncharacterized membrane protein YtjA (UPF0391 family)